MDTILQIRLFCRKPLYRVSGKKVPLLIKISVGFTLKIKINKYSGHPAVNQAGKRLLQKLISIVTMA